MTQHTKSIIRRRKAVRVLRNWPKALACASFGAVVALIFVYAI